MKDSRQLLQEISMLLKIYRKRKDYQTLQTNKQLKKNEINTIVRIDFCCCGVPFVTLLDKEIWKWKICISLYIYT